MELQEQIKKYRNEKGLSQEELAQKIYVSRQSISNWESGKCYPDINSLVLMSSLFDITLDQLIKGDLNRMQKQIGEEEVRKFNKDSMIYSILLILSIVSFVPLWIYLKTMGLLIALIVYVFAIFYAVRIEKQKKNYDIQTYKEIVAFSQGKTLDEITKLRESGKAKYQTFLMAMFVAILTFIVCFFSMRFFG